MEQFDVVYIGSGPGGYVGAIRAAQLGLKTAVIEKDETFGGTCLNIGCIPSKALLDSSEHYLSAQKELADHGVQIHDVQLDLAKMMARKDKIVKDLTGGVSFLFKKNNITTFKGLGAFRSPSEVEVTSATGEKAIVTSKNFVIATGSVVNEIAALPLDEKTVVSSTGALRLPKVPTSLLVIGGGYIGLELGSVWLRLGAQVTVVEYADHICGTMDLQISKRLLQILKKQGMNFIMEAKVVGATKKANGMDVEYELKDGSRQHIESEVVLVAAGRKPTTAGLRAEAAGIQLDARGSVLVDEHFRTNVPGIYAIGDVIRGPMLAHKAEEEGVAVSEIIAGQAGHVNYETVPGIIYTWPEVASVGKTEEQLKAAGVEYKVGTFPFTPNGRAKAMGSTEGLVKVLADKTTDRLLGVHILGPRASDMIAEAVVAMEFGGSAEDIARSFHGHPTLSEVLREAALAVDNRARQM
jgi:dihydrolipoamide dehydrogenase